eukprot:CAMPEP_0194283032 /NCGR_PEP_ID=MMETSP0169-20130528/24527_1 /TAXON_ID=218684 /ORGANISM="Corethron pennatum, Strain L29A3" /LENGTH=490 /DNA_ID=CAMNT_0039028547 /DNA_START=74 /DNA_END=1547 /DNA_ORIENTATION=-
MSLSCFNTTSLGTAIGSWFSNRTLTEISHGPIETWPTCQVTSFNKLFYFAKDFNEDLSGWDVSSVTSTQSCFSGATSFFIRTNPLLYSASSFNGDISGWDTGSLISMRGMFSHAVSFNVDLSGWDVGRVETMYALFIQANSFTQTLTWCLGDGVVTEFMFDGSDGSISERCPSPSPSTSPIVSKTFEPTYSTAAPSASLVTAAPSVPSSSQTTNFDFLFSNETLFPEGLSGWDTSSVTSCEEAFSFSNFAGDISGWEVGKVRTMRGMFWRAIQFNGYLQEWDTSQVTSMAKMFTGAWTFNSDISAWDTSNAQTMKSMFHDAFAFDVGKISNWDVSSLIDSLEMKSIIRANENVDMFSNSKFVIGLVVFAFISFTVLVYTLFVIRRNRSMEQVADEEPSIENGAGDDVLENRSQGFIGNILTMIANFPRGGDSAITSDDMERSGDVDAEVAIQKTVKRQMMNYVASAGSIDRPTAVYHAVISQFAGNVLFH